MSTWPDPRILSLLGVRLPIVQAPMAGPGGADLAAAVAEAGGLGSLACALLGPAQIREEVRSIRTRTSEPLHLNFFCHDPGAPDPARESAWLEKLFPYYAELGLDPRAPRGPAPARAPFDAETCAVVEEVAPAVVSFHFGLPEASLVERVRRTGAKILSSATSVDEARWLADRGVDAVVAQGYEAGGHRGVFLRADVAAQAGTLALVPQVVDAVKVPVIAAGGIGDGRGIAAAHCLGAAAAQLGTAYLFCPEARLSAVHRAALRRAKDDDTVLTNVFTGRPARSIVNRLVREVGPLSSASPAFPLAAAALLPLRGEAERAGSDDFTALWSGQAAKLGRELPAADLTRLLAAEARAALGLDP